MAYFAHQTTKGKVVYKRKPHFFTAKDVARTALGASEHETYDQKFGGDFWLDVAKIATANYRKYNPGIPGQFGSSSYDQKSGKIVYSQEYYQAAWLHYTISQAMVYAGYLIPRIPIVKDVWEALSPLLSWALDGLRSRLPLYKVENGVLTFY